MFAAFAEGNVDKVLDTVSENSMWLFTIHKSFRKHNLKVRQDKKFFANILNRTEILRSEPRQYIIEGNMVVVLGSEHQRVKRSGKE